MSNVARAAKMLDRESWLRHFLFGMSRNLMALIVLQTLLGSCARGLLQPPPSEGETALVTFTRESTLVGAAWSYIVTVDDRGVVAMRAGDQYTIPVAAGWRTIGIGMRCPSLRERLEAGKQYYFRVGPPAHDCPTIRKVTTADLPPVKVNLDYATPADVESKLFSESGLVHGPRRFQAAFERMVLTSDDAWRLRTFIQHALASPAGSDLKFEGTIKGAKFKARMEKDRTGSARVKFEGLTFQNEPEMEDFLAPFSTEDVDELQLRGSIAGRRIEVKREPSATHRR